MLYGWLAGVGYFAIGTYWISEPFTVDPGQTWMAPFAVLAMAGGLALFWGLAAGLYRLCRPRGLLRGIVFAGTLTLAEWLRGHVLTGFPWNLPGETWLAGSAPSQAAAFIGAYGLTWVTVALAASTGLLLDPVDRRRKAVLAGVLVLVLVGLYGLGTLRLARAQPVSANAPLVRLVQADIDQKEKWKPENLDQVLGTYLRLSRQTGARRPDVVIWPEGALPAVIDDLMAPGSPYAPQVASAIGRGQTLMMGANRIGLGRLGEPVYFNTLVVFRKAGQDLTVTGIYDKYRLVPFGEFMPLGKLAGQVGLRSFVHMPEDFTPGGYPAPLASPGLPIFQPMICYEALFPGLVDRLHGPVRPDWIVNVSNDAWFGSASGPWQHFNITGYRAIEQGLPIARSTPTGVTAMIDAFGRTPPNQRLGLGAEGVLDARLPPALAPTLYARFGDLGLLVLLIISGVLGIWMRGKSG